MVKRKRFMIILLFVMSALISGCGSNQTFGPTTFPTQATTKTPTLTNTLSTAHVMRDLLPIIQEIGPYNQLYEIRDKLPSEFTSEYSADMLVEWIRQGFETSQSLTDPQRIQYFYGMDFAALISERDNFRPLYQLKADSELQVLRDLQSSIPDNELVIYKMYNEGVIIRTSDVCIGIDIILEPENYSFSDDFADILDGMLYTHSDGDHYDYLSPLITTLEANGKPVILPTDNNTIPIGSVLTNGKIKNLDWTAFRGEHFDLRFSAFYILTVNETRILHSGDNTAWKEFGDSEYAKNLDLFLYKPESMQGSIEEVLQKIPAKIIIPQHLLELGHGTGAYGHDMGYRLNEQVSDASEVIMLQWGEKLTITYPFTIVGYDYTHHLLPELPNDTFDGNTLDGTKWRDISYAGGIVQQDERLILTASNAQTSSSARIESKWRLEGDFDFQVDFQIAEDWDYPVTEHSNGAFLGVIIAGQNYHITRIRSSQEDKFFAWSTTGTLAVNRPATALSGKYRLVRTGTTLSLLFDIGSGWEALATVSVPLDTARVYMGNATVNVMQSVTTYFDNFVINSGSARK